MEDMYTKEQLAEAARNCICFTDVARYFGKAPASQRFFRSRMKLLNIDMSHFQSHPRKYTKSLLEDAVKRCKSASEVARYLGERGTTGTTVSIILHRIREYGINTSHFWTRRDLPRKLHRTVDEILVLRSGKASKEKQPMLRRAMIAVGIQYKCANSECQIDGTWHGNPLVLEIHHKNGNNLDNRRENLQFLCPNCHAQVYNAR